jgi:hypothetical protein
MSGDQFVVDLTNYRDKSGSRVKPGHYTVVVYDAENDQTRDGKPMINLYLRIVGGEFDGVTLIDRLLPAHEKALFRVVMFLQALGLPTPNKRLQLNLRQFINRTVEVDLDDGDPWNGVVRSEVRQYSRPAAAAKSDAQGEMDLDGLSEFAEETAQGDVELDEVDV